jgi:divalent metal cation (Fe/Co/Zn/Cd) transporter
MKIIKNSFNYLEEDSLILDEYKEEIMKRSEVKKFVNFKLNSFGGLRKISCNIILNDSLTLIDLTSFVVSLQDYLLKIANVVEINLLEEVKKKKIKVRSLKQDARNSGSGNSKKNTNKKHSKKKNKRR